MTRKQMVDRYVKTLRKVAGDTIEIDLPYVSLWGERQQLVAAAEVRLSPKPHDPVDVPVIYLALLVVPPEERRKGYANRLMEILTDVADLNQWAIIGIVRPWGGHGEEKKPMTEKQLIRWYRKWGFVVDEFGGMIRLPQEVD